MTAGDGYELRAATDADLDAIWALESEQFATDAWSREMVRDELTGPYRNYLALVDADGAVQGYAGLLLMGDEADIQTIAVHPSARGKGNGKRLMQTLLSHARDHAARQVFLEVRADNPVARGLYDILGFTEIAVRPRYYQPDGVDAIVMRLALPALAAVADDEEGDGR